MIKVLFISNVSKISGAEIVLQRFLRNNENIYPVVLLPKGDLQTILTRENHKVYISRGLGELRRKNNIFWFLVFCGRYIVVFFEILLVSFKERPLVIHANNFTSAIYGCLPAKILRKPIIWHMHDIFPVNSFEAKVSKLLDKVVDCIIAVSKATKRQLLREGLTEKKILVVYNGVDFDNEFNPANYNKGTLKEKYGLLSREILVGMVGLLVERKGFHLFIEAVNKILEKLTKSTKFFIIGDSWQKKSLYKEYLVHMVKKGRLRDEVFFTGRKSNIPEILEDLDIVVHASIEEDSLPTSILEAMAMEKVVIASKIGGVPEIIDDMKNGILFTPGDVEELATKMLWAINNYEKVKILGVKAREKVIKKFREDVKRKKILKLYNSLVKKKDKQHAHRY